MNNLDIEKLDIPLMLKTEREKRFLTYEDVGTALGISASYVFRIEKGKRKKPSFEVVMKMIKYFEVDRNLSEYSNSPNTNTPEQQVQEGNKTEKEILHFVKNMDTNNLAEIQQLMDKIKDYQK